MQAPSKKGTFNISATIGFDEVNIKFPIYCNKNPIILLIDPNTTPSFAIFIAALEPASAFDSDEFYVIKYAGRNV
jgi:hypothetical protein